MLTLIFYWFRILIFTLLTHLWQGSKMRSPTQVLLLKKKNCVALILSLLWFIYEICYLRMQYEMYMWYVRWNSQKSATLWYLKKMFIMLSFELRTSYFNMRCVWYEFHITHILYCLSYHENFYHEMKNKITAGLGVVVGGQTPVTHRPTQV